MEKQEENRKAELYHGEDGKFKPGNPGGLGGKRPLAGRPPKPTESLLKELYGVLEKCAPQALHKLEEQINHTDPKVSQKACQIILSKILPERSAHESWRIKDVVSPETMQNLKEMLELKRKKDVAKNLKAQDVMDIEVEKRPKLVKSGGN